MELKFKQILTDFLNYLTHELINIRVNKDLFPAIKSHCKNFITHKIHFGDLTKEEKNYLILHGDDLINFCFTEWLKKEKNHDITKT